ncbi:hypothetical protein HP456_14670 [Bacillus haikouensis]|uniref:hypothetical protein n=1 Tax=Bacillus haikouensis TaxID=1510468 RepID=UPI001554964E|nr:hypothetical protein [Bacillus haikouensis]NQD67156.1 hypothetical protein [Bacillus haikouensis]
MNTFEAHQEIVSFYLFQVPQAFVQPFLLRFPKMESKRFNLILIINYPISHLLIKHNVQKESYPMMTQTMPFNSQ